MLDLPEHIRNSKVLTEDQVALLATVKEIPMIDPGFEDNRLKSIFWYYSLTPDEMDKEVHKYAGELLKQHKIRESWQVLLLSEIV